MEKSIPDQLSMFAPKISEGSDSATSSPGSEDGATLCGSPDGLTIEKSGRGVAPVNRSQWRDEAKVPPIRAIFGRRGAGSSASDNLQRSLESRLRAQTGSIGSILYSLTWKRADTPSGRSISRLRASALRMDDSGSGSWPTPRRNDEQILDDAAALAVWATPQVHDTKGTWRARYGADGIQPGRMQALQDQAQLAVGWSTPAARDWKDTPGMSATGTNPDGTERSRLDQLPRQAALAAWPTPNTMEGGQTSRSGDRKDEALMGGIIRGLDRSGPDATGSPAATAKRGRLNPAHSRWLMGYPPEWDACAVTAMPSSPKSRPK